METKSHIAENPGRGLSRDAGERCAHSSVNRLRRTATVTGGHGLYAGLNWAFDNVLYVYAVHRLGLLFGGILMTALAGAQCAITLIVYERMRIDWVGAGILDAFERSGKARWWQRVLGWALKRGNVVMFLVLCIFQDAFITTSYFRRGRFDGLKALDWHVFLGSVLVSNSYWTLRSGVVAAVLSNAFDRLIHA